MRDFFVFIILLILFLGSYGVVLTDLPLNWGLQFLTILWVGVIGCTLAEIIAEKIQAGRKAGHTEEKA